MRRMRATHLLYMNLVWALVGCSDGGAKGDAGDGLGDAGDDTTTDVGADGDTATPPEAPVLEREGTISMSCSEALAPTQPADREWFVLAGVEVGGAVWALRSSFDGLELTEVGDDAVLGTSHVLDLGKYTTGYGSAATDDTEVSLVWAEGLDSGGQVLRHARVDTVGGVLVDAHDIAGTSAAAIGAPRLLPASTGWALVWSTTGDDGRSRVRFGRLDDAGALSGAVDVAGVADAWNGLAPAAVAIEGGYAVAWSEPLAGGSASEVYYATIDAAGAAVLPRRRVSPAGTAARKFGSPWEMGAEPMIAFGDAVWLVFQEATFNGDFSNPEGAADLQLAIVDAAGNAVLHPVNRSTVNVNETQPALYRMGDAVGLTWVKGSAIYICAGCFVDYDIKTVLIDPATVTPVSAVATHTHNAHGYRRPLSFVTGDAVMTLASQDFHALSYPAVAVMRCAPTP